MTPAAIIRLLAKKYSAKAMLDVGCAEDTLLMTLLSARTRDEQVIAVYPHLRKRFPKLNDLAHATPSEIAKEVRTIGLFRNKALAIHKLAKMLLEKFDGKVPKTMDALLQLPGVGRKTASCVLWYAFGIPAMAVDVHVFRIAKRLGWAKGNTPEQVEQELCALIPRSLWGELNRVFVQFGRDLCRPGVPRCEVCPLNKDCPTGRKNLKRTLQHVRGQ